MSNTGPTEPLYPGNRAFVVQIERDATAPPVGRVEHIASGQARRFEGTDELAEFLAGVLEEIAGNTRNRSG